MLTQERVQELFTCDLATGLLYRRIQVQGNKRPLGEPISTKDKYGYIKVGIDKKQYKAHRIIWLYAYGVFPEQELDHINGIVDDNRLSNLREVGRVSNMRNAKLGLRNNSGITGVSWLAARSKWGARIMVNYKTIILGSYDTKEEAIAARQKANIEYGFHENHGRVV
jgi:hypothetical protein